MKTAVAMCLTTALLMAGCPFTSQTQSSPVTAVIGYSNLQGPAPLAVTFTATGSSSENGGTLTYALGFR